MENSETVRYAEENDKCYGIAGMLMALSVYDKEYQIESVSVDRTDIDSIVFSPDFGYTVNQHVSPKAVWRAMLDHYRVAGAMLMANVMCRNFVYRRRSVPREQLVYIYRLLEDEGVGAYQLDAEECEAIFDSNYNHLTGVFRHPMVHSVCDRLASMLAERRTLARAEVLEILSVL